MHTCAIGGIILAKSGVNAKKRTPHPH